MLRITKLTDYGIVMMAHFAKHDVDTLVSAREVADATRINPPTVSKLLKMLTKKELLASFCYSGPYPGCVRFAFEVHRGMFAGSGPQDCRKIEIEVE